MVRPIRRSSLWFATICATLVVAILPAQALAGAANAGIPGAPSSNPLMGLKWGVYKGPYIDGLWKAYSLASGALKGVLGKEALQPSVYWFGKWDPDSKINNWIQGYIRDDGGPAVLHQIAVFRMYPWEGEACKAAPSPSDQASYKDWINNLADGIGNARVMLILQPDLPFVTCSPNPGVVYSLITWAAQRLSQLPHATIYIDVGGGDWGIHVSGAVSELMHAGIKYVRGFALNVTHYDSTGNEVYFGGQVVRWLAARGIRGKHFVVNTSDNGSPFRFYDYNGPDKGNIHICATRTSRYCVTLGIPPTTDVANPRWGLAPNKAAIAMRLCDAYIWAGRPWLDYGAAPFNLLRALQLARSTPWQ